MSSFPFINFQPRSDGELSLELVRTNNADPVRGWVPSYDYNILVAGTRAGVLNLRAADSENIILYGGHFAYGVEPEFRGHHYAERAVRLLLPLAQMHGLPEIIITCNPDNWPSRRTCERLGAELLEIIYLPPDNDMYLEGERQKCRYRLML